MGKTLHKDKKYILSQVNRTSQGKTSQGKISQGKTFPINTSSEDTSRRPMRVAEIVRHRLSYILHKTNFRDPDLAESGKITISEIQMTPDLKTARIKVYPLTSVLLLSEDKQKEKVNATLKALNKASGFLRSSLARHMTQKHVPALYFYADDRFDYASHIHNLLNTYVSPTPTHVSPTPTHVPPTQDNHDNS